MKSERLLASMGGIADRYILEADEAETGSGRPRRTAVLRRTLLLAAAVAAALLLCAAAVYVASGGDLWWQIPDKDPEQVVRRALEQQLNKDYTISIRVESVTVDPEETVRVRDNFIRGELARRRGWSDEYLDEHFVVVKAVYYAEYDHTMTTRNDGDVVMYFYLVRDVDSGNWSIVDNTGNLNLVQSPEVSAPAPSASPGIQAQIEAYLTERYTNKYAQYYDGLHYEMGNYSQTVEDGACTATFLWTMYHLANGWDIGSDEGKEFGGNQWLQVTAALDDGGLLDLDTILVYSDEAPTGRPDYVILEEYSAPLPRIRWKDQLTEYMTGRYEEKYAGICDSEGLRSYMTYYEDGEKDGVCTATFLWHVRYPGGEGPYGPITEEDVYDLQVTAMVGEDGLLDMSTLSIPMEDRLADGPDIYGPWAPTWQQKQVEGYLTDMFNEMYAPYYDSLRYEARDYEETSSYGELYGEPERDGIYTITLRWMVYGRSEDRPGDEEAVEVYDLKVTAAVKTSGVVRLDTVSILAADGAGEYCIPVEDLFPARAG